MPIALRKIVCATFSLAAVLALQPMLAKPAAAQAADMAGIGASDTVQLVATVKAVDPNTRLVTLVGPQGNALTLKASDEVRNLPQVKAGDKVNVRYHASVVYVLAPPGTKLPDDSLAAARVRAAPGQMPAGAVASRLVMTGLVVGVDQAAHTLQLVDPSGGAVRTIPVVTPEGQQAMKAVKPGDTITAVASEAIAVAVEPTI